MHQQDRTLTEISGTVNLLREQARLMGSEVVDQNKLLYELDEHVDMTASRLERAQKKMNKFIRDNKSNKNHSSSRCLLAKSLTTCDRLAVVVVRADTDDRPFCAVVHNRLSVKPTAV